MISKLSKKLADTLCRLQVIEDTDNYLYCYGLFIVLSQCFFFLSSLSFGLLFGTLWESAIFYIMFSTLRCYAGGIHASKENTCTIYTIVALFLSSACLYIQKTVDSVLFSYIILVLGSVVVYLLCPLDSEDKPLTFQDFCNYRRKSRLIVVILLFISKIAALILLNGILYAATVSLVLESILLLLGRKKMGKKLRKHGCGRLYIKTVSSKRTNKSHT